MELKTQDASDDDSLVSDNSDINQARTSKRKSRRQTKRKASKKPKKERIARLEQIENIEERKVTKLACDFMRVRVITEHAFPEQLNDGGKMLHQFCLDSFGDAYDELRNKGHKLVGLTDHPSDVSCDLVRVIPFFIPQYAKKPAID